MVGAGVGAADSGGTLTAALTALAVVLNASTHPYFSAITWSSTATKIIGTADTAGCPFVFIASVSGGTGTVSVTYAVTTASAGPNDFTTATNWSADTVPITGDTVILKDSSVNLVWGLAQSAITLAELRIEKSYTGKIGLNWNVFATSADGDTTSATAKQEYRETYWAISATLCKLGENLSPGNPNGSQRICLDLGSNASTVEIFDTHRTPSETGRPCIRLKNVHASSVINVRFAPGGVGLAVDVPAEVSTVSKISITDQGTATRVFAGKGCTITTWEQEGGDNILSAAATVTTVNVTGGTLVTEGDYTITTVNQYAGAVYLNHIKTAASAVTTFNLFDGVLDCDDTRRARTIDTLAVTKGTFKINDNLAVTTLTFTGEKWTVQVA